MNRAVTPVGYDDFLRELTERIRQAQLRAALLHSLMIVLRLLKRPMSRDT